MSKEMKRPEINSASFRTGPSDAELHRLADEDDMVGLYCAQAGRAERLTDEEVSRLAGIIKSGLSAEEELKLGRRALGKKRELQKAVMLGREARETLTLANAGLVISVAAKYMNRGTPFLDLIQAGNQGLWEKAVVRFNPELGFKFSTYATWWIDGSIRRVVSRDKTVHVPEHVSELMGRICRKERDLSVTLLRPPSVDEIADALGEKRDRVSCAIQSEHVQPVDFEEMYEEDDERDWQEDIDNSGDEDAFESILSGDKDEVKKGISLLPERLQTIVALRFYDELTLEQIADIIKETGRKRMTRERVRQLESRAKSLLRHYMTSGEMPEQIQKFKEFQG